MKKEKIARIVREKERKKKRENYIDYLDAL